MLIRNSVLSQYYAKNSYWSLGEAFSYPCSASLDLMKSSRDVSLHLMVKNNQSGHETRISGCSRQHGHWVESNFYNTSLWNPVRSNCETGDTELRANFNFATYGLDENELTCLLILGEDEIQYNKSLSIDEVKGQCHTIHFHSSNFSM